MKQKARTEARDMPQSGVHSTVGVNFQMFLNESNAFIFDFLKQNFDFGGKKESKSNQNKNKTLIFQCHLSECLVIYEPIIR